LSEVIARDYIKLQLMCVQTPHVANGLENIILCLTIAMAYMLRKILLYLLLNCAICTAYLLLLLTIVEVSFRV